MEVVDRLLVLSSTNSGDAKSITDVISAALRSILVPPHFQLVPHHFVCSGDGTVFTLDDLDSRHFFGDLNFEL